MVASSSTQISRSNCSMRTRWVTWPPLTRVDHHADRPAARGAIHEFESIADQAIVRKPLQEAPHCRAQFNPRKAAAQAVMHAMAQRDMPVRVARDLEPVGIVELLRVAIGGTD